MGLHANVLSHPLQQLCTENSCLYTFANDLQSPHTSSRRLPWNAILFVHIIHVYIWRTSVVHIRSSVVHTQKHTRWQRGQKRAALEKQRIQFWNGSLCIGTAIDLRFSMLCALYTWAVVLPRQVAFVYVFTVCACVGAQSVWQLEPRTRTSCARRQAKHIILLMRRNGTICLTMFSNYPVSVVLWICNCRKRMYAHSPRIHMQAQAHPVAIDSGQRMGWEPVYYLCTRTTYRLRCCCRIGIGRVRGGDGGIWTTMRKWFGRLVSLDKWIRMGSFQYVKSEVSLIMYFTFLQRTTRTHTAHTHHTAYDRRSYSSRHFKQTHSKAPMAASRIQ